MPTPAPQHLPQLGAVAAGKYRVDALIGQGGMGAVYRATNLLTDRTVALKWLLPDVVARPHARERFLREARAAARISHPNVVDVYDVVEDGASLFLVMEYLEGEPLTARLSAGPLAPTELPSLLFPVLRAVIAAHARGVIHRDLKPDNVFVCAAAPGQAPVVKVLDFGISMVVAEGRDDTALTRSGMAVGTPRYMSVEQLNGERELDARVDVYALGVILYEVLTGACPFDGDSYGAIAIQVATAQPKRPRELCAGVPPELEAIVMKAMERNRDLRYRRVQDLLDALERALCAVGEAPTQSVPVPIVPRVVEAAPVETAPKPKRPASGRSWPWIAAAGTCALLATAWWAWRGVPSAAHEEARRAPSRATEPPVPAAPVRAESPPTAPERDDETEDGAEAPQDRPTKRVGRRHETRAASAPSVEPAPSGPVPSSESTPSSEPAPPSEPSEPRGEESDVVHRAGKLERAQF